MRGKLKGTKYGLGVDKSGLSNNGIIYFGMNPGIGMPGYGTFTLKQSNMLGT